MSRSYRPNRLNNPYFKKRKPPKTSRFYYSLMILAVVIFAWIYFLFYSSFFQIKSLEITGLNKYNKQDIESEVQKFLNSKKFHFLNFSNIFIFNKKDLENRLIPLYVFEDIKVKKIYTNKISIKFIEKQQKLALYRGEDVYIISNDGVITDKKRGVEDWYIKEQESATTTKKEPYILEEVIFKDAMQKSLPSYPIFCDAYYVDKKLGVGDTYPGKKILIILTELIDNIESRMPIKVKIVGLYKNKVNPKIVLYANNGWKIYANNERDGIEQFYKLYTVYNNEIKDPNKHLEYIDLRFGDRVYIK